MTVFLPLNGSLPSTPALVCPLRLSLDLLNSVHATLFLMILLGILYRLAKRHQRLLRFMIGLFVNWERVRALLGSVDHKVKKHKITTVTGKERFDLEIKDDVVLQKPPSQDNHLPPPHTLIMDSR